MKVAMDLYPDYDAIMAKLPHRSYTQIKGFLNAYGLTTKRHVWTNKEYALLRTVSKDAKCGADIYAAFPNFTKPQVRQAAHRRGIPWPKPGPIILGVPVLDAIRQEAFRRNLSLSDLDAETGGGTYFNRSNRDLNWRKVNAAVKYLCGRLTVEWDLDGDCT